MKSVVYSPNREAFCRYAEAGTIVPVYRELSADLETPVSVFMKLKDNSPCFLLESVERGENVGRYSFIGTDPSLKFQADQDGGLITRNGIEERVLLRHAKPALDPLHVVQRLLDENQIVRVSGLPSFFGGAVGYLSYDMVRYFEIIPPCPRDELNLPDCYLMFTDTLVIFDHVQQVIKVVCNMPVGNDPESAYEEATVKIDMVIDSLGKPLSVKPLPPPSAAGTLGMTELVSNFSPEEYKSGVQAAKEYIAAGDAFQIVLSQRFSRKTDANPFSVYRALRMLNPSPYMFYLDFDDFQLIGSSPEMLVRLEESKAETRPIAGTRPRGSTEEEDEAISDSLLADPKERAEHVMLVDLGRNDLGRVCRFGTVRVPLRMSVEKYSHVLHIVSSVQGELAEEEDAFSLLRACFPAGTLTGAPKIRSMEIINELEGLRRGPYGGAVGYFGYGGSMDTCITIRTVVMTEGAAHLQGGAGIVADSDPEYEYRETLKKTEVLENALRVAEAHLKDSTNGEQRVEVT